MTDKPFAYTTTPAGSFEYSPKIESDMEDFDFIGDVFDSTTEMGRPDETSLILDYMFLDMDNPNRMSHVSVFHSLNDYAWAIIFVRKDLVMGQQTRMAYHVLPDQFEWEYHYLWSRSPIEIHKLEEITLYVNHIINNDDAWSEE